MAAAEPDKPAAGTLSEPAAPQTLPAESAPEPEPEPPPGPVPDFTPRFTPRFTIELGFPAGAAPEWRRLGRLTGHRRRPRPLRIVWHDTADGALATANLALADHGAGASHWHIEPLSPAEHSWLPATPPPWLASAADRADLAASLPAGETMAVAAFAGEQRGIIIERDGEPVSVVLLSGTVSGVIDQAGITRIMLQASPAGLPPLALALAEQGAFVPRASLAAEALAVAGRGAPPARHKGAAHVPAEATVGEGLAMAIGRLVDCLCYWAAKIPDAANQEPVHQARVATRRLRSVLGLPRRAATGPLWQQMRAHLRQFAHALGEARDWDVFLSGTGAQLTALWPGDARFEALLRRADQRRQAAYDRLRAMLASPAHRQLEVELALFAALRRFETEGDPEFWRQDCRGFAREALNRRRRHLFAAGELTQLPPHELHEVRKNAKRLRYGCELFAALWSAKAVRKYTDRLGEFQDLLGQINDSTLLETMLKTLGPQGGASGGASGFAAGAAVGIAAVHASHAIEAMPKAWRKLEQADIFWS